MTIEEMKEMQQKCLDKMKEMGISATEMDKFVDESGTYQTT